MSEFPRTEQTGDQSPHDSPWDSLSNQPVTGDFGDNNKESTLKQLFGKLKDIYNIERPAYDDKTARITENELNFCKNEDNARLIDICGPPKVDHDNQVVARSPFKDADEFWRILCFQNRSAGARIDQSYEEENRPINNVRLALRSLPPSTDKELKEVTSNLGIASQATKPAWVRARIKDPDLVETVMSIYQELFRDQPRILEVWGAIPAMLVEAEVDVNVLKRATYDLYNLALHQVGSEDVSTQIELMFGKDAAARSRGDKVENACQHLAM